MAGCTQPTTALLEIANSFAVQPEAAALIENLAPPPTGSNLVVQDGIEHLTTSLPVGPPNLTNPTPAEVASFLTQVYQHLFSRAPDTGGEDYWVAQITTGAVSVGTAVLAIADGAQGNDAAVLGFKIEAADYFTEAAGIPYYGRTLPLPTPLLTAAIAAVANVVDAATEAASQAATVTWNAPDILPNPMPALPAPAADLTELSFWT